MSAETFTPIAKSETFGINKLNLDSSDTQHKDPEEVDIEHFYDILRRSDNVDEPYKYLQDQSHIHFDVNNLLKNGDTILCLACNKGYQDIVKTLVENYGADVNLCRSINNASTPTSYSSFTPTITISARRQSRLIGSNSTGLNKKSGMNARGDSPLAVCIKYGFESLAEYLIDKNADICGTDTTSALDPQSSAASTALNTVMYADFERSPLQEAIRLNRTRIVEKMLQSMFERDDLQTIEWVFAKRYDILRQVLMTENLDTIKVILPNIIENRRIDGTSFTRIILEWHTFSVYWYLQIIFKTLLKILRKY